MFKKLFSLAAIAASLTIFFSFPASAEEVFLRSVQGAKYVGMANGQLAANANSVERALKLDMVHLDGNKVAFRVVNGGSYVRAGVGQGTFLASGSPHIRGWETFETISLGNGTHALKSVQNGKLVRAGVGRGSLLAAVSEGRPRGWETFMIVPARAVQASGNSGNRAAVSVAVRGSWQIVSVAAYQNGFLVALGAEFARQTRVDIDAAGGMKATTGCNSMQGSVKQDGGNWHTSAIMQTKMLCADRGVMNAERSFGKAIVDAKTVTLGGNILTLKNQAGEVVLTMRKL